MWVSIALSRDVPAGVTRAVTLEGREMVIWRGQGGSAQVWEDRCPHRGMRLSFGFVRGDTLSCLYHGWEYGAAANCRRIPAHPDLEVPATIKANAYEATESGGMILVNLGPSEPPPLILAGLPVASLALDSTIETVLQLCGAIPELDVQLFETTLDGVALIIGWHRARPGHLILHAIARDPGVEAKALIALHRLRSTAEERHAA